MYIETDVTFNFIDDTPIFWNDFWQDDYGIGIGGNDPDLASRTLQSYRGLLCSKPLLTGEYMRLSNDNGIPI